MSIATAILDDPTDLVEEPTEPTEEPTGFLEVALAIAATTYKPAFTPVDAKANCEERAATVARKPRPNKSKSKSGRKAKTATKAKVPTGSQPASPEGIKLTEKARLAFLKSRDLGLAVHKDSGLKLTLDEYTLAMEPLSEKATKDDVGRVKQLIFYFSPPVEARPKAASRRPSGPKPASPEARATANLKRLAFVLTLGGKDKLASVEIKYGDVVRTLNPREITVLSESVSETATPAQIGEIPWLIQAATLAKGLYKGSKKRPERGRTGSSQAESFEGAVIQIPRDVRRQLAKPDTTPVKPIINNGWGIEHQPPTDEEAALQQRINDAKLIKPSIASAKPTQGSKKKGGNKGKENGK